MFRQAMEQRPCVEVSNTKFGIVWIFPLFFARLLWTIHNTRNCTAVRLGWSYRKRFAFSLARYLDLLSFMAFLSHANVFRNVKPCVLVDIYFSKKIAAPMINDGEREGSPEILLNIPKTTSWYLLHGCSKMSSASTIDGNTIGKIFFS